MDEAQYRERLRKSGYGEAQIRDYEPGLDNKMHTHDFSAMVLVLSGEFILAREGGAATFGPGDCCEVEAGTLHAEQTGPSGATVLVARKSFRTAAG